MIYDALYRWAKFHQHEKHTQHPVEHLLIEVFEKYLKEEISEQENPGVGKRIKGHLAGPR